MGDWCEALPALRHVTHHRVRIRHVFEQLLCHVARPFTTKVVYFSAQPEIPVFLILTPPHKTSLVWRIALGLCCQSASTWPPRGAKHEKRTRRTADPESLPVLSQPRLLRQRPRRGGVSHVMGAGSRRCLSTPIRPLPRSHRLNWQPPARRPRRPRRRRCVSGCNHSQVLNN